VKDRTLILLIVLALVVVTALLTDTNSNQTGWLSDLDWENNTQSLDIGDMEAEIGRLQQQVADLEADR
jgi:hypothetical protein